MPAVSYPELPASLSAPSTPTSWWSSVHVQRAGDERCTVDVHSDEIDVTNFESRVQQHIPSYVEAS
jgi:hypothetical protein